MKILVLTNHSYMLWRFRKELISTLLEENEVVISTPFVGHEEDFERMGCRCLETPVDRRGVNPATDLKLLCAYRRLLRAERPDLVLTYSIKPNIYGGLACRMMGVPYCANVQGLGTAFQRPGLARLVTVLYRTALSGARRVFFENSDNAALFFQRHIIPQKKACVLPGAGVSLAEYPLRPYRENGRVRFLFVGRIMREKGVEELFWAAQRLKEVFGAEIGFDMVGFFEDAYREAVEGLVREGVVDFHGFQEDVRPFYEEASCVVLPSYHEGMSNVLLEAASSGRALITSDIPGCREAVCDGENGFLCPPGDAQALYHAMRRFVELPPIRREEMGRAGRVHMEACFNRADVVRRVLAAMQEEGL